ncbi:hypothetical protein CDAR_211431 [Caerostris darwini]|uniref:Uncharacterized protein n=1 Tax=Caerostris darwini TaxID=1538125 RepID=A0AAV4P584_9ARAC|nr:hypothetical protein CDAR_211431 [Caerostris darwini]
MNVQVSLVWIMLVLRSPHTKDARLCRYPLLQYVRKKNAYGFISSATKGMGVVGVGCKEFSRGGGGGTHHPVDIHLVFASSRTIRKITKTVSPSIAFVCSGFIHRLSNPPKTCVPPIALGNPFFPQLQKQKQKFFVNIDADNYLINRAATFPSPLDGSMEHNDKSPSSVKEGLARGKKPSAAPRLNAPDGLEH